MSYDLDLVRVPRQADPLVFIQQMYEQEEEEDEINPGDLVPEKEERKQALAQALMAADPELTVFPFGYAEIARLEGITETEAQHRYRHLELNGPEDGPGIQITLFDDTASVTLPYWHDADTGRQVWQKVWTYLQVLEREGGFCIYDPQAEEILDLSAGPERVLEQYGDGVKFTNQIAAEYRAAETS